MDSDLPRSIYLPSTNINLFSYDQHKTDNMKARSMMIKKLGGITPHEKGCWWNAFEGIPIGLWWASNNTNEPVFILDRALCDIIDLQSEIV